MALTELIKEMEQRILDSQSSDQEEVTDHDGEGDDASGAPGGVP